MTMSTLETPESEPINDTAGEEIPAEQMIGTMEELQAAIDDGRIPMPDDAPATTEERELYVCKYGHRQWGLFMLRSTDPATGQVGWQSGPMCARCQAEWNSRKFSTRRANPSKAQ